MSSRTCNRILPIMVSCVALALWASAQDLEIELFDRNGAITFNEVQDATSYTVEWAPAPGGPWTNSWQHLERFVPSGSGTITASVAMCYRVIAHMGSGPDTPTNMALIPAGSFWMGDTMGDTGTGTDGELPVHQVTLTQAFYMDETLIHSGQWAEVLEWSLTNGFAYTRTPAARAKAATHPVHTVHWRDAIIWCNARSAMDGLAYCYSAGGVQITNGSFVIEDVDCNWSANGYRLPTEAEWEYAARGGTESNRFPWAHTQNISHDLANYRAYSTYSYDDNPGYGAGYNAVYHPTYNDGVLPYTSPVDAFASNGYGLHDMSGNLWQFCWDWLDDEYYENSPTQNPTGPATGSSRVLRGGAYMQAPNHCRVSNRGSTSGTGSNNMGFRTVRRAD